MENTNPDKRKPGKNVRQHRHLIRLDLSARPGRNENSPEQNAAEKEAGGHSEQQNVAAEGDGENGDPYDQRDDRVRKAHEKIGQHFADQHFGRAQRG